MEQRTPQVWDDHLLANPHGVADKRSRVQRMFAAIAPSYDLNNRVHSLWIDQWWRRRAVQWAEVKPTDVVVDVACGTGDLALRFAMAKPRKVIGVDFTYEMLPLAKRKIAGNRANRADVTLVCGDAMQLPLGNASADVVSIAFGIRNVAKPEAAVAEFHRILRPGGRLIILEFSLPTNPILRGLYNLYFRHILPRTATLISGDQTGAYKYLPESVNTFIDRQRMISIMAEAGFAQVNHRPMTCGVCICYRGTKP